VNEGVNIPPRGQISPLGAKFTPRGEVYPWGPGVKLRMALCEAPVGIAVDLQKVFEADGGDAAKVGLVRHLVAELESILSLSFGRKGLEQISVFYNNKKLSCQKFI
jgi:hypothetical protein